MVVTLLAAGANPNAHDNFGSGALLEAVKAGHVDVLKELVQHGASLQLSKSELSTTLCSLVKENKHDLLQRFLAAGANADACDYDKRTPLHIAAAEGDLSMVRCRVVNKKLYMVYLLARCIVG